MNEPIDESLAGNEPIGNGFEVCSFCGFRYDELPNEDAIKALKKENERLRKALLSISTGIKRIWREGEGCYQVAILADAALSGVLSDSPANVKSVARQGDE